MVLVVTTAEALSCAFVVAAVGGFAGISIDSACAKSPGKVVPVPRELPILQRPKPRATTGRRHHYCCRCFCGCVFRPAPLLEITIGLVGVCAAHSGCSSRTGGWHCFESDFGCSIAEPRARARRLEVHLWPWNSPADPEEIYRMLFPPRIYVARPVQRRKYQSSVCNGYILQQSPAKYEQQPGVEIAK